MNSTSILWLRRSGPSESIVVSPSQTVGEGVRSLAGAAPARGDPPNEATSRVTRSAGNQTIRRKVTIGNLMRNAAGSGSVGLSVRLLSPIVKRVPQPQTEGGWLGIP